MRKKEKKQQQKKHTHAKNNKKNNKQTNKQKRKGSSYLQQIFTIIYRYLQLYTNWSHITLDEAK